MKLSFQAGLLFLLLFSWGCGDESGDLEPPQLNLLEIQPALETLEICGTSDAKSLRLTDTNTLYITINISDNEGLSQLKLDIHQNFDCHGHGGQAPGFSPPQSDALTKDWEQLQLIDLEGANQEHSLELNTPVNPTAGNYHLSLRALDLSGNESTFDQIYNVVVENSRDILPPSLIVSDFPNPAESLTRGNTYTFSGNVMDDQNLGEGGNAIIFLTYKSSNSEIWTTGPYLPLTAAETQELFTLNFIPPTTITRGTYEIALWAYDGVRNIANPWSQTFEIN